MTNSGNKLDKYLRRIDQLPASPDVFAKLVELLSDEHVDLARIERAVSGDPSLTAKILSLANSPVFGITQPVTTIERAVVVIGLTELQSLALGSGLARLFPVGRGGTRTVFEDLWRHLLAVSSAAAELALEAGQPRPEPFRVAGLLHDLGKLVIFSYLIDEAEVVNRRLEKGEPYHLIEADLGLDHSELGYRLAKKWNLPEQYQIIIRNHHHLDPKADYYQETCLVSLANQLVKTIRFGMVHEQPGIIEPEVFAGAGLSARQVWSMAERLEMICLLRWETWGRMAFG